MPQARKQLLMSSGDAAVSSLDQQSTWSSIVEVAVDFPAITGDHLRQPEIDDPQHLLLLSFEREAVFL
jgi:hypothetical protein